jgi:hypothetical protein
MNFGAADAARQLVACLQIATNSNFTSVTIGGVTATQLVNVARSSQDRVAIYIANVPSGATGDVVVTMGATGSRWGCQLYSITGQNSPTPDSTASDIVSAAPTATLNVPAGGCVIGCAFEVGGSSASTTWSGITEDVDENDGVPLTVYTSASGQFPAGNGSLTVTATFDTGPLNSTGVWAVWKP